MILLNPASFGSLFEELLGSKPHVDARTIQFPGTEPSQGPPGQ